jgi:hypothetical protein
MKCPECGVEFKPNRHQVFCCTKHRVDFHNRNYRHAAKHAAVQEAEDTREDRINSAEGGEKINLEALGLVPPAQPVRRRRFAT